MLITEWDTEAAMRVWREEGIEDGREEGLKEGEAQMQREIALKMLKRGTPIEHVMEDTGLPLAEVQALQAQLP
ncbi:MAG: hypothetical protein LBN04_00425 [Oscillospiraceae bacterium]|jgi:predicted transposase/invertase (TIGR01784 family)|nr:hypothetical protein [Oscillospiraceae bacterium]